MKTCTRCKIEKPLDAFSPDARTKSGRTPRCKSCNNACAKKYRTENHEEYRKKASLYYQKNKDKISEAAKIRNKEKRKERREYNKKYYHQVLKHSPDYKASCAHRKVLSRFLSRYDGEKSRKTHEILGYSVSELKEHISRQFTKGMSWENYGEWHIDHIVSVSKFVKSGESDPAVISALSNLRPMWAEDNRKKLDKDYYLI